MYKLHLIFKYLRKRRIAWVSLAAVTLCTAMVLVVISVMGGWLRMFRESSHALVGDVVVFRSSLDGFGHYQEMMDEINKLPDVKASAPLIEALGLLNVRDEIQRGVQVFGIDIKKMAQVNGFAKSLYLQPDVLNAKAADDEREAAEMKKQAATQSGDDATGTNMIAAELTANAAALRKKAADFPSWDKPRSDDTYRNLLSTSAIDESQRPGMIVASGVIGISPGEDGKIDRKSWDFMYDYWAKLTVLKVSKNSDLESMSDQRSVQRYWMVDDSTSGMWQADETNVYVPFDLLQNDLGMGPKTYTNAVTGQKQTDSGRCTEIEISVKPGVDPYAVKPQIEKIVTDFENKYESMSYSDEMGKIQVQTWDEKEGDFLNAVEHEKILLVFLFGIISVVAVFLIFCIFYMIVAEKTRDIGIIKSVGASGTGVAGIFLGYGLTIGIVGGGMGLLMGWLIVHNINELHAWMGREMGIKIWDAKTYVFPTIPNTMQTHDVVVIVSVAILSSVLGAVLPAIRAARMNPVEALRFE